jgi:hypothetical protein
VLRGEIVALDHYCPLGGKIKGQGQHFITSQELPSLIYFTTNIQIIRKKSYKEEWRKYGSTIRD